jgi:outer membrane lipoprotein LolB
MNALTRPAKAVLLATALALGLSACQSLPTPSSASVSATRWNGRLALNVQSDPPQQWAAGFELQGQPSLGQLRVLSPVGTVVVVLNWDPASATLRTADREVAFSNLDELTRAAMGQPLPLAALFDWLEGKPTAVEGWTVDLSRHAQGRIVALRHTPAPAAELRVVIDKP